MSAPCSRAGGRPRIVHLIPRDALGGVETAARSTVFAPDLQCDFHLVLVSGDLLARSHSRASGSHYGSELNPLAQWRAARRVVELAPDVLVCSLWKSIPAALMAKRMCPSIRLVAFLHVDRPTHLADALLHSLLLRHADAIWTDSEATRSARVPSRSPLPVRTISFILDRLQPVTRAQTPTARFVSWGRMNGQKGVDRALMLIAELVRRGADASYDAWGPDGGELSRLRSLAAELGIADRVSFPGPVDRTQLGDIGRRASFYLQLSRFEGMAIAVTEGMRLGLVPVVTAVGQMADYCRDDENSVVVDPSNLERAADSICSILAQPERYARLRSASIDHWAGAVLYPHDVCAAARELVRFEGLA